VIVEFSLEYCYRFFVRNVVTIRPLIPELKPGLQLSEFSGMICDQEVEDCEKGEDGRTSGNGD
jgi:hypothetical protein